MVVAKSIVLLASFLVAAEVSWAADLLPIRSLVYQAEHWWQSTEGGSELHVAVGVSNPTADTIVYEAYVLCGSRYFPDDLTATQMETARDSALAVAEELGKGFRIGGELHLRCGALPGYPPLTVGRRAIADFDRDPPVIALGPGEAVVDTLRLGAMRSSYAEWPGTIELSWSVVYYERVEDGLTRGKVHLDSLFLSVPVP